MPFLDDKEIEDRVLSPDNLVNRLTVHEIKKGGACRGESVPIEIKKIITILGNEDERGTDLASAFDMDQATVSRAIRAVDPGGKTLEDDQRLKPLKEKVKSEVEQNRETAESKAVETLLASLDLLPEALTRKPLKPKQISSVAKDMAAIANQMANRNDPDGNGSRSMHLHLYAPKQKKVEDYEVIDV